MPPRQFPTGARPSPRHKLLSAVPHLVAEAPPAQFAVIPSKLDMWGNDQYGDCVSAEEAFAKACYQPEIFIDANTVVAWATKHGYRDGADLTSVMDSMIQGGFQVGSQLYDDGHYAGVDYSNETVLQSAISQGPVKIGVMSSALPSGAGNEQGWYAVGRGRSGSEDHCVALCGYGPAGWLYQQLGVTLPSALSGSTFGYLLYTWSTIGFVDHVWIMGAVGEAWLRSPTTVGVPPLPTPPVPPGPTPVPPDPPPFEGMVLSAPLSAGKVYSFGPNTFNFTPTADIPANSYPLVRPAPPKPPDPPKPPVPAPLDNAIAEAEKLVTDLKALKEPG